MAEDRSVNFPVAGPIDNKTARIDWLQGCMKKTQEPDASQARKYKSSGPLRSMQQKEWNISTIISLHLDLRNLLLIECITLIKLEYLQL